jgi:putative tricarboxylic transport membrane protein
MTEILTNLGIGFGAALSPMNLLFALVGSLVGTLIGVLPGIGPIATLAMLMPVTFYLQPLPALIMLAAIYYGAQYGGSTTSILVNIPGESASVITCLDGYAMARQGRAGAALAVSALGSFFAGCIATVAIALFAKPLTQMAQKFGPPEYFSLMVFGLVAVVVLARGSFIKALAMIVFGLLLGLIGTDVTSGARRFTLGISELSDGLGFVPLAMGMFGLSEIIANLEEGESRTVGSKKISGLWLTRKEFKAAWPASVRGTILGCLLGVLPGSGATLSSFAAYMFEKRWAKDPSRFGQGAIEGVAAPESANNAGAQTSFIPVLTLGIPSNPIMALLLAAMIIHGITPGPQMITERPELFWGVIASMWIGNLMLLIINLPMIGIWVRLLTIPYRLLFPAILLFCCIGVYSLNNSTFEVLLTALMGLAGYGFRKIGCEAAPLLLSFILGPLLEENLRRAMVLSRGNPEIFITRPISLCLLLAAAFLMILIIAPMVRKTRETAFKE